MVVASLLSFRRPNRWTRAFVSKSKFGAPISAASFLSMSGSIPRSQSCIPQFAMLAYFAESGAANSTGAKVASFQRTLWIVLFLFLSAQCVLAQLPTASVSGTVSSPSGAVPQATVTIKDLMTGQSSTARADADGRYNFPNVAPGKYEVSASASGFETQTTQVSVGAGTKQTLDLKLAPALSLQSLGFSQAQTQGNAKEQALLDKRSHMLQVHQKLGLITAFPLVATIIASTQAHGRNSSATSRDVHIALGSATAGLYIATAYYAIFAPKVPGVKARGPIRFHKAMAWIHGPGMILTPILGAMAESQINQGEKLHGAAKYHGDVAIVTGIAYGLALLSETKPNWIPGLGHHVTAFLPFHHQSSQNAMNDGPKGNGAGATEIHDADSSEGSVRKGAER
jgi:Carboxypeptidase regulatory-like domain